MKEVFGIIWVLNFLVTANCMKFPYYTALRDKNVDDYYGVEVQDPYKWLEKLDSYATKKFMKAQKKLTDEFFKSIGQRRKLEQSLMTLRNYKTFNSPIKKGNHYFFAENLGLENQSVISMQDTFETEPEIIFDPNELSDDMSLSEYAFSESGDLMAYALSGSSDWETIHFMNISSGGKLSDILEYSKSPSSLAWTHDNLGIFYTKYPSQNCQIYYHRLGTTQTEDILIVEFQKRPKWTLSSQVSYCGKYLIITAKYLKTSAIYVASLTGKIDHGFHKTLVQIFPMTDYAVYTYVSNIETTFLFTTNKNATNNRLISVDVAEFSENANYSVTQVISERPNSILSWAKLIDEELILYYMSDEKNTLEMVNIKNTSIRFTFPLMSGSISDFTGGNKNNTEFFFLFQAILTPPTVYRCKVSTGQLNCEVHRQVIVDKLNLDSFETKQLAYNNKNGTTIPMNIVYKKGTLLNGRSPVLLYAPDVSTILPFSILRLAFVHYFGGIFAVPNTKLGDILGQPWKNGSGKPNSFDNFISAAEYLIKNNYTKQELLTVKGHGSGGLVVGTCVNQRPDLFGAGIIQSGILDMVRFHKSPSHTTGEQYSRGRYTEPEEVHFSPLHNIKMPTNENVQYPSILVTTGTNNDGVSPFHSYKYVAELQHTIGRNERQKNPLLLKVENNGGKETIIKEIQHTTDIMAFLLESLGLNFQKNIQSFS